MTKQIAEAWRPLSPEKATLVARSHAPTWCCEIERYTDHFTALPHPSRLGQQEIRLQDKINWTTYFSVMEHQYMYYILYCVYHPYDGVAGHMNDFAGILRVINPQRPYGISAAVLRVHYNLEYVKDAGSLFSIDSGSHAISVGKKPGTFEKRDYDLVNMQTKAFSDLIPAYRAAFAPSVSFPDEWSCTRADAFLAKTPKGRELAKELGIKSVRGLIWSAPEKLIEILEAM